MNMSYTITMSDMVKLQKTKKIKMTNKQIADIFGVCIRTVQRCKKGESPKSNHTTKRSKMSAETEQKIIADYFAKNTNGTNKYTIHEICNRNNTYQNAIYRVVNQYILQNANNSDIRTRNSGIQAKQACKQAFISACAELKQNPEKYIEDIVNMILTMSSK